MIVIRLISSLFCFLGISSQNLADDACCEAKTVGGVSYTLIEAEGDTGSFGCKDTCVYEEIGSQGSRFCFKLGGPDALEATCTDIYTGDEFPEGINTRCIISGQKYTSYLFTRQPVNDIKTCVSFCCNSNVCNYWSFGSEEGQKHCYLYSQVFGNPDPVAGFASGLKGCGTLGGPTPPDPCLLPNTKITSPPATTVPQVTNYVDCQKQCEDNLGTFWSFGDAANQGQGPGTCLIFSTADMGETKVNAGFISGPASCPTTD